MHKITIVDAKDGWFHATCQCGWHAQARTEQVATALGSGHTQRHPMRAVASPPVTPKTTAAVAKPTATGTPKKEAVSTRNIGAPTGQIEKPKGTKPEIAHK